MGLSSHRPRKLNYVVNQKRSVRGDKLKKAVKHYEKLQARVKIEGETKWLKNALEVSTARLKKYGLLSKVA